MRCSFVNKRHEECFCGFSSSETIRYEKSRTLERARDGSTCVLHYRGFILLVWWILAALFLITALAGCSELGTFEVCPDKGDNVVAVYSCSTNSTACWTAQCNQNQCCSVGVTTPVCPDGCPICVNTIKTTPPCKDRLHSVLFWIGIGFAVIGVCSWIGAACFTEN